MFSSGPCRAIECNVINRPFYLVGLLPRPLEVHPAGAACSCRRFARLRRTTATLPGTAAWAS